jgi:acyl-CoA synthetase (AMP-forming)/AMP-acid ligase II
VQLKTGAQTSADDLITSCTQRLPDYKRPRSVDFVDELPRNPSGKLLKRELRTRYWGEAGRRI